MITMNMMCKILWLYYRDVLSIKKLCRQTGLVRKTVRQSLRAGQGSESK
jgi:DNA-binding transcriptional regulator LsrR (DeoR family)